MNEDEPQYGAIELLVGRQDDQQQREDQDRQDRLEAARVAVDEARQAMATLAPPSVQLIALRLAGKDVDWMGEKITDERIELALTVLDRVGIPKLRAHAIAASIATAPSSAAPGSPGWAPAEVERDEAEELDPASVDAKISAFVDFARQAS